MKKILSKMRATQIIMLGFLITILIGALLLTMPFSSAEGQWTGFEDALFTSASAVCITGLAVVTTSEYWSVTGQWIILALIQIGGLGFMSFVTMVFLAMGKRITMRERTVIQEAFNLNQHNGLIRFAKYIFKFTIFMELTGAVILSFRFVPDFGLLGGVYRGIFHSVSAFCNAGFDVLGNSSLMDYSGDAVINFTIMTLIIVGGLGFPVVQDIVEFLKNMLIRKFSFKFSKERLKLQSKIVILVTAVLIFIPAVFIFIFEYTNTSTLANMGVIEKAMASLFQSVTLRTAGFSTIDQGAMRYGTKIVSILCMFVGGSPAGTAGGAKTVTVAILIIAVLSLVRGNDEINAFHRNIGFDVLQKALSVVIMMIVAVMLSVIILSVTEAHLLVYNGGAYELLDIFYEVVSAIGTVGLTTGITPELSVTGKIIITICMYIGRVGPISLALALSVRNKGGKNLIHYPEGKIIVG